MLSTFSFEETATAMDIGVWMSRGVLAHKRDLEYRTQAWNLRELPVGFGQLSPSHRLFVAVDGYWRGFFILKQIGCNMQDQTTPWTVAFDPHTWTAVAVSLAPRRDRRRGYTLAVPGMRMKEREERTRQRDLRIPLRTRTKNETQGPTTIGQ